MKYLFLFKGNFMFCFIYEPFDIFSVFPEDKDSERAREIGEQEIFKDKGKNGCRDNTD